MASAFEWLSQIVEWLGRFIPRWFILDVRFAGVKYVRGGKVVPIGPGVHWYWPIVTTYDTYPTVRQTDNLATQSLESRDGVTFAVGGMIVYDVPDVVKLLTECHHAVKLVQDIVLSGIHDVCCRMTWEELKEEQRKGTLDTKLRNAVKTQLAEYGVRVLKCMLTDLAKARVLKIIQSTQKDTD